MNDDLINTRETPGEFDALATLRPGEPYFPLVGRDRFAPPLIYKWADKNRRRALAEFDAGKITKENRDRELRKSTQAEMIASAMVEYKNNWVATREPEARAVTYSGHDLPEDTKRRDALQAARARASNAVNGAVAALAELEGLMDDASYVPGLAAEIEALQVLSNEISPPRATPGSAPLLEQAGG